MITILVTPDLLSVAQERAAEIGKLKHSIRDGEGNLAHCLAAEALRRHVGGEIEPHTNILKWHGIRLSIKAKDVKVDRIEDHYECSVTSRSISRPCDFYIFARVLFKDRLPLKVYILGYIQKEQFMEQATLWAKGKMDSNIVSTSGKQYRTHATCYSVPIRALTELFIVSPVSPPIA